MERFDTRMMAWGPLGQGSDDLLKSPVLDAIGEQYSKTPAQVALRWLIERGIVAIPKSMHKERMAANFDIFDFSLTEADMKAIEPLNQEYKQHRAVQYYADKQALTPRHFADIIKQESGYTPMEWINMVTINQAKHLLRQPNMLVKQVADELGFPEQFTFRKYFKTNTGISPTEYQNNK